MLKKRVWATSVPISLAVIGLFVFWRQPPEEHQYPRPGAPIIAVPMDDTRPISPSQVLGFTASNNQIVTSDDQANHLQSAIDKTFVHLSAALVNHNFTEAETYLHALHAYQHESLLLLPKLSQAKKTSLAQVCANHATALKAFLYVLPEKNQIDGMLVEAGCDAILEAAR